MSRKERKQIHMNSFNRRKILHRSKENKLLRKEWNPQFLKQGRKCTVLGSTVCPGASKPGTPGSAYSKRPRHFSLMNIERCM